MYFDDKKLIVSAALFFWDTLCGHIKLHIKALLYELLRVLHTKAFLTTQMYAVADRNAFKKCF